MAGITGIGTTFNLPNYHGELLALTPADTPFLSAIGGLTGGGATTAAEFEWQGYDLRDPSQRTRTEGMTAPTAEQRVRQNFTNVAQIHQEKVSVSYTKQAATGAYSGANVGGDQNPVTSELAWQVEQALKQVARDANWSFINGIYVKPADNSTARQTMGLIQVVETKAPANLVDKGGKSYTAATAAADGTITVTHSLSVGDKVVFTQVGGLAQLTVGKVYYVQSISTTVSFKVAATSGGSAITLAVATGLAMHVLQTADLDIDTINAFAQTVFDNGGLTDGLGTFVVGSAQKVALTKAFASAYGKAQPLINGERVGGVAIDQIETDFGRLNIMLDRSVPRDTIILASLGEVAPVFLNVPDKGVFFEEPLAKTGASDDSQLYGEIGLKYGSPFQHGVLRGLKAS